MPPGAEHRSPDMPEENYLEPYSLDLAAGLPHMAAAPTTPRQQLRYARILKAAAGFTQRQFDTVSLSDVALRAHVPLGTLYRYFPSPAHLMLAVYRQQLRELGTGQAKAAARLGRETRGSQPQRGSRHALTGLLMEIFHLRVMQPAVEHCLTRRSDSWDGDIPELLREIDSLAESLVVSVTNDAGRARILLHTVSGLVQLVRCRRLSLFDAEKDLKNACALLGESAKTK